MIATDLRGVIATAFLVVIALSGAAAADETSTTAESVRRLITAGRYAGAEGESRVLLDRVTSAHGPRSVEVARACDLLVETMWRGGRAGLPEALELAERTQAIQEEVLGPGAFEIADTLVEKARVLEYVGRIGDAHSSLKKAVDIHDKAVTVGTLQGLRALTELGRMQRVMGRYRESEVVLDRALELAESEFGPKHPVTATAMHETGVLFLEMTKYPDARALLEDALSVREATLGPDHPDVADTHHHLGWLCRMMEELELARFHLERALEIKERVLAPEHPKIAQTLDTLGMLYWYAGPGGALDPYRRAQPIIDRALAENYWQAAVWIVHQGCVTWNEAQDFLTATRYYETGLGLIDRTLGEDHPKVFWALDYLCGAYWDTGRYDESMQCFERRKAVLGTILEREELPRLRAYVYYFEAGRLEGEGKLEDARDALRHALEIDEDIHGPFNNYVAWTCFHIARISQRLGDYDEARRMYERARLSWYGAWGEPAFGPILHGLSSLHEELGDFDEAHRLWRRALTKQETLNEEVPNPGSGPKLVNYARFLMRIGSPDEALAAALDAEGVIRPHLRVTLPGLSEREGLRFAATWASGLDVVLSVASQAEGPQIATAAFETLVRARALVLDEIANRQQLAWSAGDPEAAELATRLMTVRGELADLLVRGPGGEDPDHYQRAVDSKRGEKEAIERRLSRLSFAFRRGQTDGTVDLTQIQLSLDEDDALVSFAHFLQLEPRTELGPDSWPEPREAYVAFVVRRDHCEAVPLGQAGAIDELVGDLRNQMADVAIAGAVGRGERAYRRVARKLRALVWDPIAASLEGTRRVFVVPDGELNLIHLAALPADGSGYLAEHGTPIHYLAAERDLVDPAQAPDGKGVLALGAPAFDDPVQFAALRGEGVEPLLDEKFVLASRQTFRGSRSSCGSFQSIRFEPLPAAAGEVEELARLWSSDVMSSDLGPNVDDSGVADMILEGSDASETAFKLLAPGRRVLHTATHGFFLGQDCPSVLDRPAEFGFDGLPARVVGENPLLLSGLAFAGANLRESASPDEDDGILTAEEIASLDLSSVEWAVLSACDTGIGEVRSGEGVFGLRRAFQVAGARTLIMSLWPVEDEATRTWMRELYTNRFIEDMSTIDSVHEASLALLNERRERGLSTHPFYWAGFIASGDWR